ncbi:rhamnan synthesis F family protein [Azonexus sp.]|uniref:rhamnan synthesis F family protein n=1 Tax=Azonexus sp. TaxID=1872668 RepID=UPI0027B8FE1D|nr:rhamnan synthesis F family protein [Azonexus sp.]
MAQFHFVEDYERLVAQLVATYPVDEAMAIAVGGDYELFGRIQAELLKSVGLSQGMHLLDLGCGSGRLATILHQEQDGISYTGIDIVQALLDYAQSKAPNYRFILSRQLSLPLLDASVDMISAFSLFTHLLHTESYCYLAECARVLRPGGKVVFSFLEFAEPHHWHVFEHTAEMTRHNTLGHLNMFIERSTISIWAAHLGFQIEGFIDAAQPIWESHPLGQSIALLSKPAEPTRDQQPSKPINESVPQVSPDAAFASGVHALREHRYQAAVEALLMAFQAQTVAPSSVVAILLTAYQRLYAVMSLYKSVEASNTPGQMATDGQEDPTTQQLMRVGKFISKQDHGVLYSRIVQLAESTLIDPAYVAKQLGLGGCTTWEAAFHLHTNTGRKIHPNIFFDAAYYKAVNNLPHDCDAIEHYLGLGCFKHFSTHRLLDVDWLTAHCPGAYEACCMVTHYWQVGYPLGILPSDPAKVTVDPRVASLFFLGRASPELSLPGSVSAPALERPLTEEQINVLKQYFSWAEAFPRFVPIDFSSKTYLSLYPDLENAIGADPLDALSHYLKHGIREARAYNLDDVFGSHPRENKTFDTTRLSNLRERKPLCVLMHLYYVDLWEELDHYLDNIDLAFDLYVNLVESTWSSGVIARIRKKHSTARILISPNAGRDIGGYMRLLEMFDAEDYLAIALVHSKKSQHISAHHANTWRRNLLQATLGSTNIVRNNLAAFAEDPSIGIIGAAKHRQELIGKNEVLYNRLLDIFEIDEDKRECEYVSGTMMLLRPDILKRVHQLIHLQAFNDAENRDLDFYMDGQMEHAVERLFGNVMKQLGYRFYWC